MTGFPERSQFWVADEVLTVLQCISCRGSLTCEESGLVCTGCGRRYTRLNGIAHFVDAQLAVTGRRPAASEASVQNLEVRQCAG